jgi:hypothetical protein
MSACFTVCLIWFLCNFYHKDRSICKPTAGACERKLIDFSIRSDTTMLGQVTVPAFGFHNKMPFIAETRFLFKKGPFG